MNNYCLSIRPFGLHAILIEWPNEVQESILDNILQFTHFLRLQCLNTKKWEIVPAYNSVTLILREKPIDFNKLKKHLEQWYLECEGNHKIDKNLWRLPVCYDIDFGIDMLEVSEKLDLNIKEIINLHTTHTYTVYGIGFLPGFMYLGGLPPNLIVSRKKTPRLKVDRGSVGLASKQTGIYPQDSPGGWNIIGNCPVPLFDPNNENPCFVNVGDKVQFYQIERAEFDLRKIENEVGIYKIEKLHWDA